ncbi:MAG: hypothetical protein JWP75_1988 [Frondihabitans sp.]|nr:hypothetical protein [Frondihabitans sp.]
MITEDIPRSGWVGAWEFSTTHARKHPITVKNSALKKAAALPVALLIGLVGSALLAPPAVAVPAPAPSDLLVTSPMNGQAIHGTRSITVTGRAPIGSYIVVLDDDGHDVGNTTTTVADFSIPITFSPTASYDQFLEVKGRVGKKGLSEQDIEVVFDAPKSVAPVLSTPVTGSTSLAQPTPFGDGPLTTISGTGTPGDTVVLDAVKRSATEWDDYGDYVDVAADGTWSDQLPLDYGRWSVSARSELVDEHGDPLTVVSDRSNGSVFFVGKQKNLVDQPAILAPTYPADASFYVTFFSASPLAPRVADSKAPASLGARFGLKPGEKVRLATPASRGFLPDIVKAAAPAGTRLSGPKDCFSGDEDCTLEQIVVEDGVQVKCTADKNHPGQLKFTVSGTGTPGYGIQLYVNSPSAAVDYFAGLYPAYFAAFDGSTPGPVTSHLPGWNHKVKVTGNHRWSTTIWVKPGPYFITAFAIKDAGGLHPAYSLASNVDGVNVKGTPAKAKH